LRVAYFKCFNWEPGGRVPGVQVRKVHKATGIHMSVSRLDAHVARGSYVADGRRVWIALGHPYTNRDVICVA